MTHLSGLCAVFLDSPFSILRTLDLDLHVAQSISNFTSRPCGHLVNDLLPDQDVHVIGVWTMEENARPSCAQAYSRFLLYQQKRGLR